jgi:N-acetylglutamate synthase
MEDRGWRDGEANLDWRLEEVALNAWPAFQQVLLDGWVVRFANGYTKRANSVNPLYASRLAPEEKIAACEALYAAQGLPPVFRLTPHTAPPELDIMLAERSYRRIDLSVVLHVELGHPVEQTGATLRQVALDDWMPHYSHFTSAPGDAQRTHRSILERIATPRLLACLEDAGEVVACGMGVLEGAYFGLFDIITGARYRNRGYGTALVAGMLAWAQEHGALHAYLQVVGHNDAARRLYARLGFRERYTYWYRVPGAMYSKPI